MFLFSDTQIKYESFVEDINNLLNSGEVPNMFPYDERAAVLEACRVQSKKDGLNLETPTELWLYFVDRTKANLHIVLCFSPIGDAFRERLRQFPSLVNCCTIDWFKLWPNVRPCPPCNPCLVPSHPALAQGKSRRRIRCAGCPGGCRHEVLEAGGRP